MVPLEFLSILPGQPVQETSPEMLQEMIRQTAIKPHVRFPKIDEIVRAEYAPSTQERRLSEDFGIEVDPQSVRTTGRVLQPCTLRYGNQVYQPDHRGSWNLRNVPFKRPAECAGWAMVQCVSDEQMRGAEIAVFINTLSRVAGERQMRLGQRHKRRGQGGLRERAFERSEAVDGRLRLHGATPYTMRAACDTRAL
jgi:hypothetical protein